MARKSCPSVGLVSPSGPRPPSIAMDVLTGLGAPAAAPTSTRLVTEMDAAWHRVLTPQEWQSTSTRTWTTWTSAA